MDLNAALNTLIKIGQDGKQRLPEVTTQPYLPSDTLLVRRNDEAPSLLVIKKPRLYTSSTIQGFCEALNYLRKQVKPDAGPVFVTVGSTGIVAILGEEDRRDVLQMPLTYSAAYDLLNEPKDMTQDETVAAVRELFNQNISPNILGQLRTIRFNLSNGGEGNIETSRTSFRAETVMEISGLGSDFPDQVLVSLVCFNELYFGPVNATGVQATLRINIPKARFRFVPLAGELESAEAVQLNAAATYIRQQCGEAVFVATNTIAGEYEYAASE